MATLERWRAISKPDGPWRGRWWSKASPASPILPGRSAGLHRGGRRGARAHADFIDGLRRRGRAPSRFAGIPFSVKDLFDLAGEETRAGSKQAMPKAARDAPAIAAAQGGGLHRARAHQHDRVRLFGVGLNPHHGTPRSVWDRATGRIPGGSSSGAGVSVAEGMCPLAIGTDTGGSCRIPAAYNGIVGWKPSVGRVPTAGAFPLSRTLDSVGPLQGRSPTARWPMR